MIVTCVLYLLFIFICVCVWVKKGGVGWKERGVQVGDSMRLKMF